MSDQITPGLRQSGQRQPEVPGQRRLGVVAQAMGIGDAEQEQMQRPGADVSFLGVVLPRTS